MVVDEIYKDKPDFKKIMELTNVLDVVYVPYGKGSIIKRHFCYTKEFRRLVERYRPRIIFHHDPVYSSMMYLHHWAAKMPLPPLRVSYLSGMSSSINFKKEFETELAYNIDLFLKSYKLPKRLGRFLFLAKGWLKFSLDYYILPLLFIRRFFSPPINPSTFDIFKNYWNDQFDFYLLYGELDKKVAEKMFGSADGIREVQHPLKAGGERLNRVLYDFKEENSVLILPTYGHINKFQEEMKKTDAEVVGWVSSKWIEAIREMKIKFVNYSFIWKLHPTQKQDSLWQEITDRVRREHNDLTVIFPEENAQKLILKSKVVVSDVSSVLWWSSFFADKISISFDIFGISSMDFFKNYEDVYYFNNLKSFSETDFTKGREPSLSKTKSGLPMLSDFLEEVCKYSDKN